MFNLTFSHITQYPILITLDPSLRIQTLIKEVSPSSVHIIADSSLPHQLHKHVHDMFKGNWPCFLHPIQGGEALKTWHGIQDLIRFLSSYSIDRQTILLALGGGTIGDSIGFLASILRRGVRYIQYPTSLLAQVDSAIGGKTGINTLMGKNLIGSFYHPIAVICDLTCLDTLSPRDMASGYAEIVKYALINDPAFWTWLQDHGQKILARDPKTLHQAITTACQHKMRLVEQDPFDYNERALLNFGHSFGHVFETIVQDDTLLNHGEAVAIGMAMAAHLSVFLGHADQTLPETIEKHLQDHNLPITPFDLPISFKADQIITYLQQDKKYVKQGHRFILLKTIGKSFVSDPIMGSTIHEFLTYYEEKKHSNKLSHND